MAEISTASDEITVNDIAYSYDSVDSGYQDYASVNSEPVLISTLPNTATNNTYVYSGGDVTISAEASSYIASVSSGYAGYDQVNFETELKDFSIDGGNIYINSNSGTLTIQNTRGHYMKYADVNGAPFAYSYVGTNEGNYFSSYSSVNNTYIPSYAPVTISANSSFDSIFGVIVGGDSVDNVIYATSNGSSLWGGNGGNDTLVGGSGNDEFVYNIGNGNDVIQNAGDNDVVNLQNISLSQVTSLDVSSGIVAQFSDGGSINIQGTSNVGIKVEGTTYAYNRSSGTWYTK